MEAVVFFLCHRKFFWNFLRHKKPLGMILSCLNLEYIFFIYRFANLLKVGIYLNEKQRSIVVSVDFKLCLEYN